MITAIISGLMFIGGLLLGGGREVCRHTYVKYMNRDGEICTLCGKEKN